MDENARSAQTSRDSSRDWGRDWGLVVIQRLHRMVRHGYRPWLGYDTASALDRDIHLRRRDGVATLHPDGSVVFATPARLPSPLADEHGVTRAEATVIAGDDGVTFDALFPADTPNKRNLMRRLYEIGLGG